MATYFCDCFTYASAEVWNLMVWLSRYCTFSSMRIWFISANNSRNPMLAKNGPVINSNAISEWSSNSLLFERAFCSQLTQTKNVTDLHRVQKFTWFWMVKKNAMFECGRFVYCVKWHRLLQIVIWENSRKYHRLDHQIPTNGCKSTGNRNWWVRWKRLPL